MATKGDNFAFDRRQQRKKEGQDCGSRGKMLGRYCRYNWGGGVGKHSQHKYDDGLDDNEKISNNSNY